jgi:uncharacterized lipoprotein YmbA
VTPPISCRSFLWLAVGLMSACGSLFPKSPPSDFYLLTAADTPARPPPPAPVASILLRAVAIPPYLDRHELVTLLASNQLRVEDLEVWAEPLRDSVPRTIERDLGTILGEGRVQRRPWTGASPPVLVIDVEIRRFEKTAHQTVELVAAWEVVEGAGTVRLRRNTKVTLASTSPTTRAAVTALSDALTVLSRDIARGVQQVAPPGLASRG